jgi:O-antigen/teichoic acid export membrane protein
MSNELPAAVPPTVPPQLSLRHKTTRGAMWVGSQAMVGRVVMFAQQLILAWLLAKSDFGLIGLAFTVTAIAMLMANPGVDAVLVQRPRRFRQWATPAFWLGQTMGLVGAAVMLLLAPVAAHVYDQPRLIGLIAISAAALPIQAMQIVPKAQLQMEMRFRAVVLLGLLGTVLTAVLTILCAALKFGPYSFVIPLPIVAAIVSAATWRLARSPVRRRFEFSRWKYLFGNSVAVGATELLNTFINQGDTITLGLAGIADASIGAYVFAFNIAVQPLRLNMPMVLFPGLSHLSSEPAKQVSAALRAMRLVALTMVPICMLQILLAGPIFRLVFPPRWQEAVLPCQILTLGLMINALCWPGVSLLRAQGRFRAQMWANCAAAIVFAAIMATAISTRPSIIAIAIGVCIFHCLFNPFLHWLATHKYAPLNSFFRESAWPLVAAALAAVPCISLQLNLPASMFGDIAAIAVGGLIFCGAYLLLCYLLVPASLHDLIQQLTPFWNRWRPGRSPAADTPSRNGATT